MTVRAKICGIRSETDLLTAVESGADALGFICGTTHFSEDVLDPEHAARLVALVPPFVSTVLVTHQLDSAVILGLAATTNVDVIQIHGPTTAATTRDVWQERGRWKIIKAVHVTSELTAVDDAKAHAPYCDAVLLDSRTSDRLGGTGRTHDWTISRLVCDAMRAAGKPTILAGGLNPSNVHAAIKVVAPYAVDVNSGVEDGRGDKRLSDCAEFVSIAHSTPTAERLESYAY